MIVGTWLFDKPPARSFHCVSIVKTQNPPITGIVQGQFIPNAVRSGLVGLDYPSTDLYPVLCPDPDIRSVEIKQDR